MNELTVIITYYNKEEYIQDCIRSLKNQRNQDFDVIIVNDGSEDKTTEILFLKQVSQKNIMLNLMKS